MKQNPTSQITFATFSNVELSPLFDHLKSSSVKVNVRIKKANQSGHHEHTHNSYSKIKSITLPLVSTTTSLEIEKFLQKWKNNLLRAKGYVSLKDGTYLMQHAMKRVSWERSTYNGDHYLVLIGMHLNEDEIKEEWRRLVQKIKV
ncbi:GTP-binding protein [Alkalihalobacillus sp. MEB130]|uniref:GTP-binding protein n=1 Tax=Alkalihalobacillus sp. MEB130 TaxID=2976704 RepID=UPI0028DEDF36|nr:GTP-binding protein [Alkalihalobacillus sp. MEB130]MDT8862188.1 GTP-binding protein [Alkalihalobacillus sp. MEB130]